jgi:predicted Abi (CAAX) family protease
MQRQVNRGRSNWLGQALKDHRCRCLIAFGLTVILWLGWMTLASAADSQYEITGRAEVNQIDHYPVKQTLPGDRYRPVGNWVGRLILPGSADNAAVDRAEDWVWLEIYHAPSEFRELQGQRVRLEWRDDPGVRQYVAAVTRDVRFGDGVAASQREGNLHADRLNGRAQVGPLQSLAGARSVDDVVVSLDGATVRRSGDIRLQIDQEPMVESGRSVGLVKILAPVDRRGFIPSDCPGKRPCPSELFQVQHYSATSGQFDGATEIVRIPQQPRDQLGVFASTPRDLAQSAAGTAGWYIYGAADQGGLFTVQALKPRALFQLQPQQRITDRAEGVDYINYDHWQQLERRKGRIETVLIDPNHQDNAAPIGLKAGQQALVIHLFGGRGGKGGEVPTLGTVTGHFSYGLGTVVREPIANELQWDLRYQQVYATNTHGVISGTNSWAAYMGDLRRGWLGTRPVSDILVRLDVIEDYEFGGVRISPLQELGRQLQVINARYRIGDGGGAAIVTPATSCVQDSNQALFSTIQQVRRTVATNPTIQAWLTSHGQDPTALRFQRLVGLGDELERQLMPIGIVREDWRSNSEGLAGTQSQGYSFRHTSTKATDNFTAAMTSWRTILPRRTQDELSLLFLNHGAQLWILQTNQVGGIDPDIFPIAPTKAFGRWTIPGTSIAVVGVVLTRVLGSINLPEAQDWWIAIGALVGYGTIALGVGLSQGFLRYQVWQADGLGWLMLGGKLFVLPALVEELVFRVLWLPTPRSVSLGDWVLWAIGGLIAFVLYHPLNALLFYKVGNPTFFDGWFLVLTGLLGVTCTVTYGLTGSLLLITLIYWLVVVVWLVGLGGMARLKPL